jgi:hypothetical protein
VLEVECRTGNQWHDANLTGILKVGRADCSVKLPSEEAIGVVR